MTLGPGFRLQPTGKLIWLIFIGYDLHKAAPLRNNEINNRINRDRDDKARHPRSFRLPDPP